MRSWLFLLLSALLQVGWLISLRASQGFTRPVPVAFYALFGLGSAVCLARSLSGLPMSTAYATWTGVSVAGSVLIDMIARRQIGLAQLFCIALILVGTTGLKLSGDGPSERSGAAGRVASVEDEAALQP